MLRGQSAAAREACRRRARAHPFGVADSAARVVGQAMRLPVLSMGDTQALRRATVHATSFRTGGATDATELRLRFTGPETSRVAPVGVGEGARARTIHGRIALPSFPDERDAASTADARTRREMADAIGIAARHAPTPWRTLEPSAAGFTDADTGADRPFDARTVAAEPPCRWARADGARPLRTSRPSHERTGTRTGTTEFRSPPARLDVAWCPASYAGDRHGQAVAADPTAGGSRRFFTSSASAIGSVSSRARIKLLAPVPGPCVP